MIKKIERIEEISSFDKTDLFTIRIMSLLKAYGTAYDFASFYKQINANGRITAILSRLDNDLTLSYENANTDEIKEFIAATGFSSLLTDEFFLFDSKYDEGVIMSAHRKNEFHMPYAEIDEYPKLMDLYNFEDYGTADFESWYVDVSHRIRHGCGKAYALTVNGEIASSGIFSSIYRDNAILTSVHTAPEFRGLGYGTALVSAMICDIKKTVFLMRESDKNESFYKNLGFENNGKWRMYR